jgi:hypothetical protein
MISYDAHTEQTKSKDYLSGFFRRLRQSQRTKPTGEPDGCQAAQRNHDLQLVYLMNAYITDNDIIGYVGSEKMIIKADQKTLVAIDKYNNKIIKTWRCQLSDRSFDIEMIDNQIIARKEGIV